MGVQIVSCLVELPLTNELVQLLNAVLLSLYSLLNGLLLLLDPLYSLIWFVRFPGVLCLLEQRFSLLEIVILHGNSPFEQIIHPVTVSYRKTTDATPYLI